MAANLPNRIFACLLPLLIGISAASRHPTSTDMHLRWKIRAEEENPKVALPGTDDPLDTSDKLLVVARHKDDISWTQVYLGDIPIIVYQMDEPENLTGVLHTALANKGNEAMAYLQYIIDHYDALPRAMVFMHGHRESWHLVDKVPILRRLKWGQVGYANLRYAVTPGKEPNWNCGIHFAFHECDWQGLYIKPGNLSGLSSSNFAGPDMRNYETMVDSLNMAQVWDPLVGGELGPVPEAIRAPCCSEFHVTRDLIHAHSKGFYIHMRDFILTTEKDSHRMGKMFEHLWHIIFGESPVTEAIPECTLLHCEDPNASHSTHSEETNQG